MNPLRELQVRLANELRGTQCQCGSVKKTRPTFCAACYRRLPRGERQALYRRIGEGYEEAYVQAIARLNCGKEGQPS